MDLPPQRLGLSARLGNIGIVDNIEAKWKRGPIFYTSD